jgi:hypothetical protein
MITTRSRTYWAWGLLLLFLLGGGYLRLAVWTANPLEGDQSTLISIAMRFVSRGWEAFPLTANKSSAGLMNPPLVEYLYIVPLLLRPSLATLHWFQAGLSLAAVALLYFYAAPLFGQRVALVAALFLAVSPWAVYYGRFIWNPNPIPFFSTLLLLSLLAVLAAGRSPYHLIMVLVALTAVTQLHLSGLVLIIVVGLCLLLLWPHWVRPSPRPGVLALLVGGLLSLLLYFPFLLFQRAVDFADLRLISSTLLGGSEAVSDAQINSASLLLNLELASGRGFIETVGLAGQVAPPLRWLVGLMQAVMALTLLYVMVRPLWAIWHQKRAPHHLPPRDRAYLILALWLLMPILLYVRHTVHLQNYYFLYLFPAPFLALALLLDDLWHWLQTRYGQLARLLLVPLLLLVASQFYLSQMRLAALQQGHNLPGRTVAEVHDALAASRQALATHPDCGLIVVAEGDSPEVASLSLMEEFLYPVETRFIDRGRGYINPATCMLYLNAVNDDFVASWLAETAVSLPYTTHLHQTDVPFYHLPGHGLVTSAPPLARWQNGLALLAADLSGDWVAGGQLVVTYEWLVEAETDGRIRYHFFNHLLNQTGELVAQEDTPAINAIYWRTQDRLVTRFFLNLPPTLADEPHSLRLGLYSWPDLQRVPLTDGADTYQVTTWPNAE